jgi:tetratricopeptide (TPR) repeat protein
LPAETNEEKQIIEKAKKHYISREFDSAGILFNKVLELNKNNIRAIYYVSKLNIELKKYNESLKYCQHGLEFDGDY